MMQENLNTVNVAISCQELLQSFLMILETMVIIAIDVTVGKVIIL